MRRPPIGGILTGRFGVLLERLEEALSQQREARRGGNAQRIGEILVKNGAASREMVARALAEQWRLPFLEDLPLARVDPTLAGRVPIAFARKHLILPLWKENGVVAVVAADPLDVSALDDVRLLLLAPIVPQIASPEAINEAINRIYERAADSAEQAIEDLGELSHLAEEVGEPEDLLGAAEEAPVVRLVNSILFQAVQRRASDIHFEPFEREMIVRYRIDGVLYNVLTPPKRVAPALISRVKIMGGMNIAEKRLPQDGRIGLKAGGREIDIRVSDVPTAHGERLVLRLLDKTSMLLNLEDIGLSPEDLAMMNRLIRLAHGIILVTGPTGSGKTTTLYAALSKINAPDKNIITIEDPIEYQLKGVGQIQVNPKIDLTFGKGLRSILRQDPDIIMVGEIRDTETAEIAIHASLTGHLVFSTLHTNDAAGAITRLVDMGIEPFLVSSSIVAIVAQRLVRLVCSSCRVAYQPTSEEVAKLGPLPRSIPAGGPLRFFRGKGCADCMMTGYWGRTGIYEILLINDEIRNLILSKVDSATIKNRAIGKGMATLRQDGARNVAAGVTTTEEALRVTQEEIFG